MNPFVFIIGCPRSGTTLLQRLVDAHPRLTIIHETHWIPKWYYKARKQTPRGCVNRKLIRYLLQRRKFARLGISRAELEQWIRSGEPVSYADFVGRVFDRYGEARGKPLVGDKTPAYARNVDLLHTLWPKAKFVHLMRDGRDVCLSAINWRKPGRLLRRASSWREDPDITAALWWEWHVRMARLSRKSLSEDLYYEMRYESLVVQPAEECAKLCAFLGLAYDEAMLRFYETRRRNAPGLDAKEAWLPVTPGLRDWRSQMSASQLERFETAAGDLLDELGYSRAFSDPSPEARRQVLRVRDLFINDVRSRRRPMPERLGPINQTL
jgi:hypothetical protein